MISYIFLVLLFIFKIRYSRGKSVIDINHTCKGAHDNQERPVNNSPTIVHVSVVAS